MLCNSVWCERVVWANAALFMVWYGVIFSHASAEQLVIGCSLCSVFNFLAQHMWRAVTQQSGPPSPLVWYRVGVYLLSGTWPLWISGLIFSLVYGCYGSQAPGLCLLSTRSMRWIRGHGHARCQFTGVGTVNRQMSWKMNKARRSECIYI